MKEMTKWERIQAAIRGKEVDRIPISLWKHYHLQDRAPRQLARVSVALHRQFDTDLVKLTPSGLYPIQDWGPAIQFGRDDDFLPLVVKPVIEKAADWLTLPRLDVRLGALGRELETIYHTAQELDGSAPFMMTLFNPLTLAYKLCGDRLTGIRVVDTMRQHPRELHVVLAVITDTVIEYAAACLDVGASGFFFATQMATYDVLTGEEYLEFGRPYDLKVLESIAGKSKITMMHVCKQNLMFDLVADYPVDVINWADRTSGTSLADARQLTGAAIAGGLSLDTLLHGTENEVIEEARGAFTQAGRTGFILAPGCVIKGPTPDANLAAARQAVDETRRS
ncbi:MAG: hypothetical protein JXA42_04900 [Anaerolineales bacterium]|nr:hypothetical protein [Anaerolineales bacterium]